MKPLSDMSTFESNPSVPENELRRVPAAQAVTLSPQPVRWNDLVARPAVTPATMAPSTATSPIATSPNVPQSTILPSTLPSPAFVPDSTSTTTEISESERTSSKHISSRQTSSEQDVHSQETHPRAKVRYETPEMEKAISDNLCESCVRDSSSTQSSTIPESAVTALTEAASALQKMRWEVRNEWEQQLFVVAVAMARKILQRELTRTMPISLEKLESILDFVVTYPEVRLALHPDDFTAVAPFQEQLRQSSGLEQIVWESDATVVRGGCRLRWAYGSLEAGPEQELQRILEEWMPEEV